MYGSAPPQGRRRPRTSRTPACASPSSISASESVSSVGSPPPARIKSPSRTPSLAGPSATSRVSKRLSGPSASSAYAAVTALTALAGGSGVREEAEASSRPLSMSMIEKDSAPEALRARTISAKCAERLAGPPSGLATGRSEVSGACASPGAASPARAPATKPRRDSRAAAPGPRLAPFMPGARTRCALTSAPPRGSTSRRPAASEC